MVSYQTHYYVTCFFFYSETYQECLFNVSSPQIYICNIIFATPQLNSFPGVRKPQIHFYYNKKSAALKSSLQLKQYKSYLL